VIENALIDYREGGRSCEPGATQQPINMCAPANGLATADLAAIAEYYAALPFVAASQQTDAAKAALGKAIHDRDCEICHSEGGGNPADDASVLAGQRMDYLRFTLVEYQAGARLQPRPMAATTAALSPADIDALVHFYASQQ
jgi:sulfide dehydrogenase cytochrome subunit